MLLHYESHFISTNYSFATLFDADRRKIIKASYFYAHLINDQKRAAYAERVENQKKDAIIKADAVISDHAPTPKDAKPNRVIDHLDESEKAP